jgi:hypothetical protein
VVFLGPSLPVPAARRVFPADFRPPAAVGDVYRAALADPDVIVLIDGYFAAVPSVWHKELLYALARGIPVVGASSMGALRAAEMAPYGMIGVGEIYQRFVSGEYQHDDEVAVIHGPAEVGHRCMSHALVNIRHGLAMAVRHGVITEPVRCALLGFAERLYYPDRHWSAVLDFARQQGVPETSVRGLAEIAVRDDADLKRQDALAALRFVASAAPSSLKPARPPEFEPTNAWLWFVAEEGSGDAEQPTSGTEPYRNLVWSESCIPGLPEH